MQAYYKKETEHTHDFWLRDDEKDMRLDKFKNMGRAVVYDGKYYAMVASPSAEHEGDRRQTGYFQRQGNEWVIGGRKGANYHGERQFDFVLAQNGGISVGKKDSVGHTNLADRKMVKFAGTITFLDGNDPKNSTDLNDGNKTTILMTRGSGHYKPAGLNSDVTRAAIKGEWGAGRVGTQSFEWEY